LDFSASVIPAKAGIQLMGHRLAQLLGQGMDSRLRGNDVGRKVMRDEILPTIYILASHRNGTLYVGVTSDLIQRLYQHRDGTFGGFTSDHGVLRLVWFETGASMEEAIRREKQIKKWNRQWKINLIERSNPDWRDLGVDLGLEMVRGTRLSAIPQEMDSRLRGNDVE
jgi:putative endonuclease